MEIFTNLKFPLRIFGGFVNKVTVFDTVELNSTTLTQKSGRTVVLFNLKSMSSEILSILQAIATYVL